MISAAGSGETYGFRDGFNLSEDWFEDVNMGLNQAPIVVMIENYRSGLVWKLLHVEPRNQASFGSNRVSGGFRKHSASHTVANRFP